MQIFWLFFMLAALQPVITQRLLEASRKRLIGRIENERNSRVVLLVHRQETMSLLGFPVFRYIDINDSEEVLRAIHMTDPEIALDLVLHSTCRLAIALADEKLIQCLIHRQPRFEVRVRLTDQLECILISKKIKHGLSFKAIRKISSSMLKPFADFFPPNHCCFTHARRAFSLPFSPFGMKRRRPKSQEHILRKRKNASLLIRQLL
jgi:Serine dehydrogenase proteinase